jgi:conserved oligomeric Golgi complex subunit 1
MVQVETQTRNDIEDKKIQLRRLVGDSYCDLISSADTIQAMATCCKTVLDDIAHIREEFSNLAKNLSDTGHETSTRPYMSAKQLELYGVHLPQPLPALYLPR